MANTACPTPARCGARSHVPGTAAARACASGAATTSAYAAPAPTRGYLWEPGTVHPTGGYDQITTDQGLDFDAEEGPDEDGAEEVTITSHLREGALHRTDGPAVVLTADDGAVVENAYHLHGQPHRGDGLAVERPTGERSYEEAYYYLGDWVGEGPQVGADFADRLAVLAQLEGLQVEHLVGWTSLEADEETVAALAATGRPPEYFFAAWEGGVRGLDALVAVAARRAPASWATRR